MGRAEAGWTTLRATGYVLVCRKCRKRAGRKGLGAELKAALRASGRTRTRTVETGCLSVCPKGGGVAIASAASLAGASVYIWDRATTAEAAVSALLDAPG